VLGITFTGFQSEVTQLRIYFGKIVKSVVFEAFISSDYNEEGRRGWGDR